MSDKNFVIVIGREYGSGGRRLGKSLSKRLGIPYYDKELLSEAATRLGFRADLLEKADERPPSPLRSMLGANLGSNTWFTGGALHRDALYKVQSDVIRAIAAEGPCVIVGRTADYVLRDMPGMLSIFLHGDIDDRVRNVKAAEAPDDSEREIRERIEKRDNDRRAYYNYYTGRNWGAASNYHLTASSSRLPLEAIEEMVAGALGLSKASD